jgi:hypothetical protein
LRLLWEAWISNLRDVTESSTPDSVSGSRGSLTLVNGSQVSEDTEAIKSTLGDEVELGAELTMDERQHSFFEPLLLTVFS